MKASHCERGGFFSRIAKLELEYKSIQGHHEEHFEAQSRDLSLEQENIMALAYDIDEIRRRYSTSGTAEHIPFWFLAEKSI